MAGSVRGEGEVKLGTVIDLKERKTNRYKGVSVNHDIAEALKELRQYVENQGTGKTRLVQGIYQTNPLDEVQTTKVGAWEFGYQVKPTIDPGLFERNIFIKLRGQKILEVPKREREPVLGAVFDAMIDKGNEWPEMALVTDDCIRIRQHFAIVYWNEFNPGIVTPGKKG